jgi:UDP-glucose 4-epimerase
MRVLVTGGAGFIGSTLVQACLEAGDDVRVLDDFSTGRTENLAKVRDAVDLVKGSVADPETVQRAIGGCEIVYHHAAQVSVGGSLQNPLQTHYTNLNGTLHVLEAARQGGVRRVIFASSCAVYGASNLLPLPEEATPAPRSPYALQKLSGELYCRQFTHHYGLETVALRYFNVFGPRQDAASLYAAVVPLFLNAVARSEAPIVHGDGGQSRDFIYVDDVVEVTRAAAAAPSEASGEVFNVGRGERVTVLGLLERICAVLGRPVPETVRASARAGDIRESQADISKARRVLSWRPRVTLDQGLLSTAAALGAERQR